MKLVTLIGLLLLSTTAMAQDPTCDLSSNDRAVTALNERMDNAEMSGEDHLISLMNLHRERMELVQACVEEDNTAGVLKSELQDVIVHINSELEDKVAELNDSIRISIEVDRIGMATELTMERDLLVLEAKNLIAKIQKLIAGIK